MTRFNITVVTKQAWSAQVEAKDIEEARQIRDKFADRIQEDIAELEDVPRLDGPKFECVELFGGDDFTDDDIDNLDVQELPEAERASLTAKYCLFSTCPECGTETEYDDEQPEYGRIMDDMNSNGFAIVKCPDCETEYKQISYKEY